MHIKFAKSKFSCIGNFRMSLAPRNPVTQKPQHQRWSKKVKHLSQSLEIDIYIWLTSRINIESS